MATAAIIKKITLKLHRNSSGCWEYTGKWDDSRGYKNISIDGKTQKVHRVMFQWFWRRKLRKGIQLDHGCNNRACCNPLHLEPMKNKRNSRLRSKRAKTKPLVDTGHLFNQAAINHAVKHGVGA